MYRIGEFSKMSKTTIKALRYYDEIGLLKPCEVDKFTMYRMYSSDQLFMLHKIRSLRQLGISIDDIKKLMNGENTENILEKRKNEILAEISQSEKQLSQIEFILSGKEENYFMNYQATIKQTPECIVYSQRFVLPDYSAYFEIIPAIGKKVMEKYPDLKCSKPEYCFNVYLDCEYREKDINVEYCESVTELKPDFDDIHFKKLPPITVVSIFHKGGYNLLSNAYAFVYKWIEENNYIPVGGARESYIDGIWNKENEEDWLTEIQVPITSKDEVKEKYGDTKEFAESQSKNYSQKELQSEADKIFKAFSEIKDTDASSKKAAELVKDWQDYITKYHYECSKEILSCLGQMYVNDERFTANIDRFGIGTADFMSNAIKIYCK